MTSLRFAPVASSHTSAISPALRIASTAGCGKLLEVYLPVKTPAGRPLLFEAYQSFGSVTSSGRDLWLAFAPALVLALVVLELVQLPLASSMARRIRRGNAERESLLQRAVDSSTAERRRIAGRRARWDSPGSRGALLFARCRGRAKGAPTRSAALRRGAQQTRESVRELRRLLVEIYPPRLQEEGLEPALADLMTPLARRGIETRLEVPEGLELDTEREALIFRVAQEAVKNACETCRAAASSRCG